jgi:hypothetical protein
MFGPERDPFASPDDYMPRSFDPGPVPENPGFLKTGVPTMGDLGQVMHKLGYIRRPIDIAANYYSGATNVVDPSVEPVPIPELTKEALLPSERYPTPIPGLGLVPGAGGIAAIQEMRAAQGDSALASANREAGDIASRVARPALGFAAGLATDPTTFGALGVLKKAGATGEALHGILTAAFTGTMGVGAVNAARQVAAEVQKNGFSRELIEPMIEYVLAAAGTVLGAQGTMSEFGAWKANRLARERERPIPLSRESPAERMAREQAEESARGGFNDEVPAETPEVWPNEPPAPRPPTPALQDWLDDPYSPTRDRPGFNVWPGETDPALERAGLPTEKQKAEWDAMRGLQQGIRDATDVEPGPPRIAPRTPPRLAYDAATQAAREPLVDVGEFEPRDQGLMFRGPEAEARIRAGLDPAPPEPPPDLGGPGEPATFPPDREIGLDEPPPFQLPEDTPPFQLPVENVTEQRFRGNTKEALERAGLTPSKSVPQQVREAQRLRAIESKGVRPIPVSEETAPPPTSRAPAPTEPAPVAGNTSEVGAVRFGRAREVVAMRTTGEQGVVQSYGKDRLGNYATVKFPSGTRRVRPAEIRRVGEEPLGGLRPGQKPAPLAQPKAAAAPAAPKPPEVTKVIEAIKSAKPVRKVQEQLYTAERAKRLHEVGKIQQTPRGEATLHEAKRAMGGALPKAGGFEGVRGKLTGAEVDALHDRITTHRGIDKNEKVRAGEALNKILDEGNVPQDAELALLEEVFGKDFTDAVLKHQSLGKRLVDWANAPRALKSAIDMSAPLRQGLILSVGHPVKAAQAFGQMFKAFANEGGAQVVRDQIRNSPNAHLYKESGLYLAKRLGSREENFLSRLAEKIPGVERSERAYETYLNKLRMDTFDSMVKDATTATGKALSEGDHAAIADFINKASGRGSLGALERSAPILNTVFFAPRFVASRFQILDPRVNGIAYTRLPKGARQHAVRSVVGTIGLITTTIGLAKLAGADVEDDVRSSDFGKIRVGNSRVDLWAGMLPTARLLGQIYTSERKTQDDKIKHSTLGDTLLHATRGKFAPVPGVIADFATEKTYSGGQVTPMGEAAALFAPMFLQDLLDAYGDKKGHPELLPLAFFGAGVSTYHPSHTVSTAGQKRGIYQMLKRGAKSDKKAISKFFYGLRKSEQKPPEANR